MVSLYIAVTLDGFIASQDDDVSWLEPFEQAGLDYGYQQYYDSVDTLLMGFKTYEKVRQLAPIWPYEDKPSFVFSLREDREIDSRDQRSGVELLRCDVVEFVKYQQMHREGRHWLVGGGRLTGRLLNAGVLSELVLTIIPVTLGSGIPWSSGAFNKSDWTLQSTQTFDNGVIQLVYVRKEG